MLLQAAELGNQMSKTARQRQRRSVALLPEIKDLIERVAEERGVSVNRAIEEAIKIYVSCMEQRARGMVTLSIRAPDAAPKETTIVL